MTGLIGSFRYHPDAQEICPVIAKVGPASLSHHGPDTNGEWHSPDGLCRLAAHPSHSHSHCGRFTLVFNGAIYNHLEVRHVLRFSSWRGETDRETLVEGLAQRGPALLLDLRGMFAFAAYDHHKQQLLLGRDRLGIQPLYMAWEESGLRFASERRALPGGQELSPQSISQMLAWGHLSSPAELVPPATAGVHSLPAGLVVRLNRNRPHRPVRYWPPQPRPDWGPLPIRSATRARSFLRDQLEWVISEQLLGEGPVGCFLSSSLNSAILLAVACRIQPGRISSFSLAFAGNIEVERSAARQIAAHCGANHHQLSLEADEAIAWVKEGLVTLDQPTPDGLHTFLLSRAMREQGCSVVLSSHGADELFGGCQSHRLVPWLLRIGWLPTHLRHQLLNWLSPALAFNLSRLPSWDAWHLSLALRRLQGDAQLAAAGAVPLQWPQQPPQRITQAFGQISWAELFGTTEPGLLCDCNTLSKACSLELRFPFLDHQLVETALRMPKRYQRPGNWLLRQACADLFPEGYLNRPRKVVALPMASWMRGSLRQLSIERLEHLSSSGLLDPVWIRNQWIAFESGALHWSQIWNMVVLGEFGRRKHHYES